MRENKDVSNSVDNIYRLDGRVPISRAIPFGLQHVLAMFVGNITPILLVGGVAVYNGQAFTSVEIATLIQSCMIVAGIGTLIQLYPIWRIGSRLPIVMGCSFTFLAVAMNAAAMDYGYLVGAVIVGGIIEGVLGLTIHSWQEIIQPVVSACVVTALGFSILNVGVSSFGSSGAFDLGSWQNLLVGGITLVSCLIFHIVTKGFWKQLYILFGMVVGYICSIFFGMVDFADMGNTISELGVFSFPRLFAFTPKFDFGIIVSFVILFLVSAVETIGDTTAVCTGSLGREVTDREISGSLAVDGLFSAISGGVFGCTPISSFSQNVGLLQLTKVVNRFSIMFGALIMILGGLFPPIGAFISTLPDCVLGGCTVIMFGSILVTGVGMLADCGLGERNTLIAATSLCIGIGITQVDGFFELMPSIVGDVFGGNPVAGVFVVAFIMSLILPKDMDKHSVGAKVAAENAQGPAAETSEASIGAEEAATDAEKTSDDVNETSVDTQETTAGTGESVGGGEDSPVDTGGK